MDFDTMAELGDNLRKARREGTIADQCISPTIVHTNCDPGDENDYVRPWHELSADEKIETWHRVRRDFLGI